MTTYILALDPDSDLNEEAFADLVSETEGAKLLAGRGSFILRAALSRDAITELERREHVSVEPESTLNLL